MGPYSAFWISKTKTKTKQLQGRERLFLAGPTKALPIVEDGTYESKY